MAPCRAIVLSSGTTIYAHAVVVVALCGLVSAQEDSQQLSSLQRGLIGAGAGILITAAVFLAFFIWRTCRTHGGRFVVHPSSALELDTPPVNLAGAHDSIVIAKRRKAGAMVNLTGRIPSDVERGITAHYGLPEAAHATADSAERTAADGAVTSRHCVVAVDDVTDCEQQCLRAANAMDSVTVAHSRSKSCQQHGATDISGAQQSEQGCNPGILLCDESAAQCNSVGNSMQCSDLLPRSISSQGQESPTN